MKSRPIGVFDSGVGGLTVVSMIKDVLPNEDFIYVGDNANSPYGEKTKDELYNYAKRIIEYFIKRNVKMVVLACNTTSANVLTELKLAYKDLNLIGVIDSTVDSFSRMGFENTLVIATTATIENGAYQRKITAVKPDVTVYAQATPKFVPAIESGVYLSGIGDLIKSYIETYKDKVNSLILGCTHYPIIANQIKSIYPNITLISSSSSIVEDVKQTLIKNDLINNQTKGNIEIYTTGNVEEFIFSSNEFFDYKNKSVKHLDI